VLLQKQFSNYIWIFRGQAADWPLKSRLERICQEYEIPLNSAAGIEIQMIRDFRRRYSGPDRETVIKDGLYCLGLMQHYGGATRLLDFTYSPYVAAYFALESANKIKDEESVYDSVIWCINSDWCAQTSTKQSNDNFSKRWIDKDRDGLSFEYHYLENRQNIVIPENPVPLYQNNRLLSQQGLFLCPGNVTVPFMQNLCNLVEYNSSQNILKIRLIFSIKERIRALESMYRMNINYASLFTGDDTLAHSMITRIPFYYFLAKENVGDEMPKKYMKDK
jgi:hypothetical protein